MKKLIVALICVCVLITGCSTQKASNSDSTLKDDSIILVGQIIKGLESIVNNETSDYDTSWYENKYKGNESELFNKCVSISSRFEECKSPENRDKISPLLDDMLAILGELK